MDSLSPDNISGVRILSNVIKKQKSGMDISSYSKSVIIEQHMLIKHVLVGSASSSHTLHKLLWTLDSRSPYDIKTRESAATIVAHIAGSIRLKQFPGGIQCIASLLGTHKEECRLMEPYKIDWLFEQEYVLDCPIERCKELWPEESETLPEPFSKYEKLVLKGLRILGKLAASSEENCRVISNTNGLMSRIMTPVTLGLLYNSLWSELVKESLKVLGQLMTAAGDTGKKLRQQIANNKEVMKAIENILNCNHPEPFAQQQAMGILCQLYMDTSFSIDTESRKKHINILLYVFASAEDTQTRQLAGEKLATIASKNRSNAMVILDANDQVLDNLIAILLRVSESNHVHRIVFSRRLFFGGLGGLLRENSISRIKIEIKNRICAAEILEQLCIPYIKDILAEFMTDVVPKVLREMLGSGLGAEDDTKDDRKLVAALLSLSVAILDKLVSNEQELGVLLNAVALGDGQFSLPRKLKGMVERNSEHTTGCLEILKLISMMVISMTKHVSCFVIEELKDLVHTLSSVSENMKALDGFMVKSGDDGTRIKKTSRTLVSIVKEAQDLVERDYTHVLGTVDHNE